MMKSMQLTSSKHSNTPHSTTALALRTVLLLSFLLLHLGGVWGQKAGYMAIELKEYFITHSSQHPALPHSTYSSYDVNECWLEFVFKANRDYSYQWGQQGDVVMQFVRDANWNSGWDLRVNENISRGTVFSKEFTIAELNSNLRGSEYEYLVFNDYSDQLATVENIILYVPDPFSGDVENATKGEEIHLVGSRLDESTSLNIANIGTKGLWNTATKYARFYIEDVNGNPVSPDGVRLTVTTSTGSVTPCSVSEKGFYIYNNGDNLTLNNISVKLEAPKKYKQYKVVGVFSTTGPEFDGTTLKKESNFYLQYKYIFTYPNPATIEHKQSVDWRRNGMTPDASSNNPEDDWGITLEELAVEQYVKWYVVDGSGEQQALALYSGSRGDTWTISATENGDYKVDDGKNAVLTRNITSISWDTWGSPTFYAPADVEYNQVYDYKIICKIYANNNGAGNPYAQYTFSLYKSFLGELKVDNESHHKIKMTEVKKGVTSLKLPLEDWIDDAKYARIWLTTADGTMVDPTGKLLIGGATAYGKIKNTDITYGYYLANENGIDLTAVKDTLELPLGTYNEYQLHVALSKDLFTTTAEPDYDYVHTFSFYYPIKTKYKTLIYNNNNQCTPHLLKNWAEVAGDCGEGKNGMNSKLYVRWYLARIGTDAEGNTTETPLNITLSNGGGYTKITNSDNGYYKFGGFSFDANGFPRTDKNDNYVPTITLPGSTNDYADVRLICVATTKTERYSANSWDGDPDEIQVKYVYTLKTATELQKQPFVHYQGEAYRYLKEIGNDDEAEYYDYRLVGEDVKDQLTWNILTNSYVDASNKKIRQNVHTVDYYYYVDDNKTDEVLLLPMQDYTGVGQDTEPRAYIRWYDFNTDRAVPANILQAHGWLLNLQQTQTRGYNQWGNQKNMVYNKVYVDYNRGLFGINFKKHVENNALVDDGPTHKTIGVTFNAQNAFGEGKPSEYLIACDVSRYMDGMDESYTYLVHEPTLSIRYLFHIRPASAIAKEMKTKAMDNKPDALSALGAVEYKIMNRRPTESISILENDGRTVVSTNNGYGEFSLRTRLSKLGHYYIENEEAKSIWWYAYCQDTKGKWWRRQVPMTFKYMSDKVVEGAKSGQQKEETIDRSREYQAKYSMSDFQGSWQPYDDNGNWDTATSDGAPSIGMNSHIQLVACVGAGTNRNIDNDIPIIWTELEFIDAKPLELGTETTERSVGTMYEAYGEPTTLNFDNFSLYGNRRPENSYQNYATVPLRFETAQYGLSYPQLYGLCFTTWDCSWNGYGMSPLHGDYLLLKSMGMDGISWDEDFDSQSMFCNWWNNSSGGKVDVKANAVLYDVTHEREHKEDKTLHFTPSDTEDYGGFLYVDAADEARTIASLEFNAELCSNAKIYYTAYIASVCGNNYDNGWEQTPPMLRFRVTTDGKNGERIPVVTFVTGDIKREVNHDKDVYVGPNAEFKLSHWYQVYGYTTIPAEVGLDGKSKQYYVEIDNYCDDTDGADYCIDQISFYTTNAQLSVKQATNRECKDEGVNLNIYIGAKGLQEQTNIGEYVYWRIYDENGNPHENEDLYKFAEDDEVDKDPKDGKPYGKIQITAQPNELVEDDVFTANSGYFKLKSDGLTYFSLANKLFKLDEDNYYISVFQLGQKPGDEGFSWGSLGEKCSVYSPVFVPKMVSISVSDQKGNINPTIEVACSDHVADLADLKVKMVVNVPDDKQETGYYQSKEKIDFDFFIGTEKEYNNYYITLEKDDVPVPWYLSEAIIKYRARDVDKPEWNYNVEGLDQSFIDYCDNNDKQGWYKVIQQAVDDGLLYLLASNDVKLKIDEEHSTILALAINKTVKNSQDDDYEICTPLPLTFNVKDDLEDPSIMLGFRDVTYANNLRVIRVGKKQLENMQEENGFLLHIPVNKYQANKDMQENDGKLYITSGKLELLRYNSNLVAQDAADAADDIWTNDPKVTDNNNLYVASFETTEIKGDEPYISLKFHGEGITKYTFNEGFTYRMFFTVKNGEELDNEKACEADVEFLMKVVPEYVTWNGGDVTGDNQNENINWNNDKNWSRSRKAELYKTENNTDGYQDNGTDEDENDVSMTPRSFVPMKFTYVTIPSGNKAPELVKLEMSDKKGQNGIIDSLAINKIVDGQKSNAATDSIEFDMMVKIDAKTECEHGSSNVNVYDLEKYYGNVCKQIYFKPNAELVHQQFLTYEKAWVEKTLTANKWYLMSTPLKHTYAGDMYVPYSTDATKNGRQETEAFQDIKFTNTGVTYSRTLYPIYQRSWGTEFDSKVYVTQNSSYDAGLSHGSVVETTMAEWGHTFNDVQVPYTERTAFAIRAHKKDKGDDALLRLPKDDTSYDYYGYDGSGYSAQGSVEVRGNNIVTGRFITDANVITDTPAADAAVTISTANLQQQGGYILVGNPYVASLDMSKFIGANSAILDDAYYTYGYNNTSGVYEATAHGVDNYGFIRPLEAFFVKLKSNATGDIVFNEGMMIDGNNPPQTPTPAPALTMTASNGRGQSSATLSVGEEARSVETLFDSNLEDVPMVYTVADGQAVSIQQLTELSQPVAFGVTCAASNDPVEVTFTDIDQLTGSEVRVVDAVTGSQTAIGEGDSYTVQPNDYGRYFLLAGTTAIDDKTDVAKGIMVSVRGREVTVTSGEELTQVHALTLNGTTHYEATAIGTTTTSFTLSSGVYVIKTENVIGEKMTVKIIVK